MKATLTILALLFSALIWWLMFKSTPEQRSIIFGRRFREITISLTLGVLIVVCLFTLVLNFPIQLL